MADRNGYIGRAPGDSSVTVARQTFSPTGVTTDFTFASGYVAGYFDIFINGVKMIEGSDYTSTDGSTFSILNGGAVSGDVIEGVAYKAFNLGDGSKIGIQSAGTLIGNVNTLNFVGTGNTFSLNGGTIDVSISGGAGAGGTFAVNSTGIHTTKSVGIGTTTATGAADTNNTAVLNVGIVTANSLFGTLTGDVTGDVTGTATGLSGSPNITINNLTGVAATFTGVLTYEDVTNVDSVGIITARSHVSIADSILHTGDTDTSIRFPAANTFTAETAGSERLRITSSGQVVVGDDASRNNYDNGSVTSNLLHVERTAASGNAGISICANAATAADVGAILYMGRTSGTSNGDNTIVESGDLIGRISFQGADGSQLVEAASIKVDVDGTPGADDMPGRMEFHTTADGGSGSVERMRITSTGEVRVGSAFSVGQAGVCTAAEFHGDGSNLTNLPAAGITTEAFTSSGIVTAVRLGTAQDHKITATGFTTITSSGDGTEGESHTIRIINSGIATVGFSTYFLFPSGAAPTMPTADGAVSLISFTVHDSVGAGCTQLLAGASVNFS